MKTEQIEEIAKRFRQAILSFPKSAFPWNSSMGICQFPTACCGDTSQTLATYIFDQTGIVCSYVHGRDGGDDGEIGSHAWLEYGDLVIDITADQFNDNGSCHAEVYIGPRTEWYNSFELSIEPDGRHSSLTDKGSLDDVYARICSGL